MGDMKVTTSSLLTQVAKFGDEMNVIKCLLWPIFLVGAESNVEAERNWALSMLERIWRFNFCANAKSSVNILRSIWQKKDLLKAHMTTEEYRNFDWIGELSAGEEQWML